MRSGIPCATVLTVSFVLSLVIGLFVTITGAIRQHRHQLDASVEASGPHDFAVREEHRSSGNAFTSIASRAPRW
jgi:hypothetical protein